MRGSPGSAFFDAAASFTRGEPGTPGTGITFLVFDAKYVGPGVVAGCVMFSPSCVEDSSRVDAGSLAAVPPAAEAFASAIPWSAT